MGNSLIIAQNISKTFVAKGLFSAKKENHVLHHVDVPSIENIPEGCRFAERCPHKTERCTKVEPKLYEQNDGTKVKCFLFEEGR